MVLSGARRVLDPFAGSGIVSMIADTLGIPSHYNDLYRWTTSCARALLTHSYSRCDLLTLLNRVESAIAGAEPSFITEYYHECYFTPEENLELDGLLLALEQTRSERLQDLLFYGIAQAALAKMPMSMFHRASIAQRLADVPRHSGNIVTWSTPFGALVPKFIQEAVMFSWQRRSHHTVTRKDALGAVRKVPTDCSLFLDPPYLNSSQRVPRYDEAYHFLEGFRLGHQVWEQWLDGSHTHPIFRGAPLSSFETSEGWTEGMGLLLDKVDGGTVIATARVNDRPGSADLRRLLRSRFEMVRARRLHSSTIFTKRSNPEYLFWAS
jgi:hypothetical protein